MKNLVKIFSVLMMIVGTFAFGQKKELSPKKLNFVQSTISNSNKIDYVHIEWGIRSKGCEGFGLCEIHIVFGFTNALLSNNFKQSGFDTDYLAIVEFTDKISDEYNTELVIEEDTYISDYKGKKLYVPAGKYHMRNDLSKNHNYILPVKSK